MELIAKKAIEQAQLKEDEKKILPDLPSKIEELEKKKKEKPKSKKVLQKDLSQKRKELKSKKQELLKAEKVKDIDKQNQYKKEVDELQKQIDKLEKEIKEIDNLNGEIEIKKTILVKEAMEKDILGNKTTVNKWFGDIINSTFLGEKILFGIHKEFDSQLKKAEKYLISLKYGKDSENLSKEKKSKLCDEFGIKRINGLRQPKPAAGGSFVSTHCYGLAIDINFEGNPFIGLNCKNIDKIINRATKLILGKEISITQQIDKIIDDTESINSEKTKYLSSPKSGTKILIEVQCNCKACRAWKALKMLSDTLIKYLNLKENKNEINELIKKNLSKSEGDDKYWIKQIVKDYKTLWNVKLNCGISDFKEHSNPIINGFIDLDKRIVHALVNEAKFSWGGEYPGAKDIMHFDWRDNGCKIKRTSKIRGIKK
jgi:hypothetical protein